jgi:hypothetical protein
MVRGRDRSEATQTLFYFQILFKFVFNSISIYFQKFLKYIFPMTFFRGKFVTGAEATQTLFYFQILFKFVFNLFSKVSQIYISHEDLVCIGRFCELTRSRPMVCATKLYFISKYFSNLFQFNLNLFQKFLKIYFPMILRDPPQPRTPPQVGWGPTHHRESHTIYTTHQVGNRYAQVESSWAWEACAL